MLLYANKFFMEISKQILTAKFHVLTPIFNSYQKVKLKVKIHHLLILIRNSTQKTNCVPYGHSLLFDDLSLYASTCLACTSIN